LGVLTRFMLYLFISLSTPLKMKNKKDAASIVNAHLKNEILFAKPYAQKLYP